MGTSFSSATFDGRDLTCRRGGRTVFAGLSFSLAAGAAMTLRGPNGSGKTTLLRLMAGLARARTGRLTWNGTDVSDDQAAHGARLAFAGHLDAIKPALSVRENLSFWADLRGTRADIDTALRAFSIAHLADIPARVLSAGQRHRVALTRIVMSPAQLWLLDEPANTLDDASLGALRQQMENHLGHGGMIVMAAHGETLLPAAGILDLRAFISVKEPEAA